MTEGVLGEHFYDFVYSIDNLVKNPLMVMHLFLLLIMMALLPLRDLELMNIDIRGTSIISGSFSAPPRIFGDKNIAPVRDENEEKEDNEE